MTDKALPPINSPRYPLISPTTYRIRRVQNTRVLDSGHWTAAIRVKFIIPLVQLSFEPHEIQRGSYTAVSNLVNLFYFLSNRLQ